MKVKLIKKSCIIKFLLEKFYALIVYLIEYHEVKAYRNTQSYMGRTRAKLITNIPIFSL